MITKNFILQYEVLRACAYSASRQQGGARETKMAAELFFKGDGVKLGEGPFYDEHTDELLWVDINSNSVNFLSLRTKENRSLQMAATVGAVIPVADSPDRLVALVGKKVCLVNRETGAVIKDLAEVDTDKEHQTRLAEHYSN